MQHDNKLYLTIAKTEHALRSDYYYVSDAHLSTGYWLYYQVVFFSFLFFNFRLLLPAYHIHIQKALE